MKPLACGRGLLDGRQTMNTFNDLPSLFESAEDGGGKITFLLAESREESNLDERDSIAAQPTLVCGRRATYSRRRFS